MGFLRVNHPQSFRLKSKIQNSRSIQLLIYSLFSFFLQTSWEYYWWFNREWNRRLDKKRFNQSYHPDEGNCYQDCIKSKLGLIYQNRRLKAKRKQMLSRGLFGRVFFVGSTRVMGSLNIFNFPAKKLRKIRGL